MYGGVIYMCIEIKLKKEIYDILLERYKTQEKVEKVVNHLLLEIIKGNFVPKSEVEKLRNNFERRYKKLKKELDTLKSELILYLHYSRSDRSEYPLFSS